MTKRPNAPYPKRIGGSISVPGDELIGIPEMELSFQMDMDSKGNRRVVSIMNRIPARFTETGIRSIYFESAKTAVEYNLKNEVYSVTMTSLDAFIDNETGMPTSESEVEEYCRRTDDMDLLVLLNSAQFMWTHLLDSMEVIEMSGKFIRAIIKTFLDKQDGDQDKTPPE